MKESAGKSCWYHMIRASLASVLLIASPALMAETSGSGLPVGHYPLPSDGDVIGEIRNVVATHEDTLIDIGHRFGLGVDEMQRANPDLSLWYPGEGAEVVLPMRHILPPGPREGLVVNLPEMRLYYYPPATSGETPIVETYPISVGRDGFATPVATTKTTVKVKDPHWSPPRSMREEAAARGEPPPAIVPPGPDNPLGRHAILLGIPSYLIHGTNRPEGVGMRASRGCIRMLPQDIESLYERVPSGTTVRLINEPFKAGWDGETLYVQSFPLLEESDGSFVPVINALDSLAKAFGDDQPPVDYGRVRQEVEHPKGQPIAVLREAEEEPLERQEPEEPAGLYEQILMASGLYQELEIALN
ncbi:MULTISPECIES: L,D-transpeptidase family protein [Halomonadaceae]|uniref:L,D-transpeptidase family protein n=1 Tax=Halomonadaceae TaxID=28256 RepID=UPI00200FEB07|nr:MULTISPECIES: L,D-transpeptidase family protein [unclassified Halomonas]